MRLIGVLFTKPRIHYRTGSNPPSSRRSGQAADDNIADIGPLCEYRKMEGKHILAIVLGALVAGIAIEARVKK